MMLSVLSKILASDPSIVGVFIASFMDIHASLKKKKQIHHKHCKNFSPITKCKTTINTIKSVKQQLGSQGF